MPTDIRQKIRFKAKQEGFEAIGFTTVEANAQDLSAISSFLKKGWNGEMSWMAREFPEHGNPRGNPKALMPDARSIIVLGANYGPETDPLEILSRTDRGAISVYARTSKDYHDVLKKRMKRIGRWLAETFPPCELKVFVDTAPIMEKPLAARAGIGWQGKHTNLVSRQFGSWLFLGEIFTTLKIPPDRPEADHCGNCNLCMHACPTDAIVEPYKIDARRCISYLTIEHKGPIEPSLMDVMGNRVYGCDDCLSVCPWTKFSQTAVDPNLQARSNLNAPKLSELSEMDDAAFRKFFSRSPIKRTGHKRFLRNILIAIGNSDDRSLLPVVKSLASNRSSLIADTARWALNRLTQRDKKSAKKKSSQPVIAIDPKGLD